MPQHKDAYIIRTHDRLKFKECREAWNFGSKIRMNLEPNQGNLNMDFGTAMHAGLEAMYDPKTWSASLETKRAFALVAFEESWRGYQPQYENVWDEYYVLGRAMIERYTVWAELADDFIPLYVEIEFEVPIVVPDNLGLPPGFRKAENGQLMYYHLSRNEYWPVYYQGRIDMIIRDKDGYYWIVDHKTAGKLDPTDHLEMDEQTGSYCWAIERMLGIPIRGVIYNELVKSVPGPPKELKPDKKGRKFSQDKSQNTTVELYKETLDKNGISVVGYMDFLDWLKDNERSYFRRTQVHRSQRELKLLGERICLEAIDMLNNPSIYPAPTKFKCGSCFFRGACLSKMDGSDYDFILAEEFHVRG